MEEEKAQVLGLIDQNKKAIYGVLDKMEKVLGLQEQQNDKQEKELLKQIQYLEFGKQEQNMEPEGDTLEEIQSKSISLLENIYHLLSKIDKNFNTIFENLPKPNNDSTRENNELDLIFNRLLADSLHEKLDSCGDLINNSQYIHNIKSI